MSGKNRSYVPKRKKNRPKLIPGATARSKTGRIIIDRCGKCRRFHVMADTDAALELREKNPAAWKRLPKELREDAEEAERVTMQLAKRRISIDHWPPEAKKLLNAVRSKPDSEWIHLPVPDVLEMVAILKKRGRPRDPETSERIHVAAQCKTEGVSKRKAAARLNMNYDRARVFYRDYRQEIDADVQKLRQVRQLTT
jgi:Asp-tRNA(Asn)/Glu-tRNA(Gln) amidotransferase A subunit family amidase